MGDELVGKRVLELGCGLGLAGITAGLMGAEILFTDYVQEALEFAERNAGVNGLPAENSRFRILDWERVGDLEAFDLILGSEIVYDYFFHGSLISLLRRAVAARGVVLLADRKRLCVSRFVGRLHDAGFLCSETVSEVRVSGFPTQEITVFSLRRA
jgi:predicted nicotinamide N-methyase